MYNVETLWPDDAAIIRAHDLGPEKNLMLLRYYAQRQPERNVYFFDRATGAIRFAGTVSQLLANHGEAAPLQQH